MDDLKTKLDALSAKATRGEWETGHSCEGNYLYAGGHHIACISSPEDDGRGGDSFIPGESPAVANAELCAALVNAYRDKELTYSSEAASVVRGLLDAIAKSGSDGVLDSEAAGRAYAYLCGLPSTLIALPAEPDAALVAYTELKLWQRAEQAEAEPNCTPEEAMHKIATAACRAVLEQLRETGRG